MTAVRQGRHVAAEDSELIHALTDGLEVFTGCVGGSLCHAGVHPVATVRVEGGQRL